MLTAAEWNERYPDGTAVLFPTEHGLRAGMAGRARVSEQHGVSLWIKAQSPNAPLLVALADVTPLATDAERLVEGWLDPTGVEIVWDERAKAITERDEARARLNEVSNDRLAQLRRFAAQQPVIDAAREWSKVMRLAEEVYGPAILRFQHSRALADAVAALDAAEAAPC